RHRRRGRGRLRRPAAGLGRPAAPGSRAPAGALVRSWTRAAAATVAGALVALWIAAPLAGAGTPEAPRLLVLSLPTLAWEDLYQGDTPALDALLDEAAVGAMSVRDVLPLSDGGDGYAAMSAATRGAGVPTSG